MPRLNWRNYSPIISAAGLDDVDITYTAVGNLGGTGYTVTRHPTTAPTILTDEAASMREAQAIAQTDADELLADPIAARLAEDAAGDVAADHDFDGLG